LTRTRGRADRVSQCSHCREITSVCVCCLVGRMVGQASLNEPSVATVNINGECGKEWERDIMIGHIEITCGMSRKKTDTHSLSVRSLRTLDDRKRKRIFRSSRISCFLYIYVCVSECVYFRSLVFLLFVSYLFYRMLLTRCVRTHIHET